MYADLDSNPLLVIQQEKRDAASRREGFVARLYIKPTTLEQRRTLLSSLRWKGNMWLGLGGEDSVARRVFLDVTSFPNTLRILDLLSPFGGK